MPAHKLEPHERLDNIVPFRLTGAELKALQEAATNQEVTISDLIRHFIEQGLESFKRQGLL